MKYLRKFETEAEKKAWLNSEDLVSPNVVLTEDVVEYNLVNPASYPLYVEATENLTIQFGNTYEYSKDNKTWSSGTSETSISANAGEKVYFRASGLTPDSSSGIGKFTISNGKCNVSGNVMSMAYGADFKGQTAITQNNQFRKLFEACSAIVDASNLILPATTLTNYCYNGMFRNCTSLVNAPELPATTMKTACLQGMFSGCTSLVNAPELPATTLADNCYDSMFSGCTSLVNAPELPATTLTAYCYGYMFRDCTSLVNAPELPATTMTACCYQYMFSGCTSLVNAPELPATAMTGYCYQYMFRDCTSLVNAPELPATTMSGNCYQYMFSGCTSLVNAPELPATNLGYNCYGYMFSGCTKLSYIKAMFKTAPSGNYTSGWVSGVSSSGTFVKNAAATWENTFGTSAIPEGWTVETVSA